MKLNNPNILVTYYVHYTNSQLSIKIVILYFEIEKISLLQQKFYYQ
jgi:hypothetical protein